MTELTFNNTINSTLQNVYQEVADNEMKYSGRGLRKEIMGDFDEDEVRDTVVSCDGTWQRRGYSPLNGVVTAISIGTGDLPTNAWLRIANHVKCGLPIKEH